MHQAERLGVILEQLAGSGSVGESELRDRLGVSAATVRRDLDVLEEQRLLTRRHGGAVAQMSLLRAAAAVPVGDTAGAEAPDRP